MRLTPRTLILGSDLAIDGHGVVGAVWATGDVGVTARVRLPGRGWLRSEHLDAGFSPSIAANTRGDLVAAWLKPAPHTDRQDLSLLRVSRRPAGSDWTRPVTLYRGTTAYNTDDPVVAMGPRGSASVAVSISHHYPWLPTVFTHTHGRWSGPVRLSRRFGAGLDLAAGPNGGRIVGWHTNQRGWCSVHSRGIGWTRPACLASGTARLAVDGTGRAYAVADDGVWSATHGRPWVRERLPLADLDSDLGEVDLVEFDIAARGPGRVAVVWEPGRITGRDTMEFQMFGSVRRPDGTWTHPAKLSNRTGATVGITADGAAYVAWPGMTSARVAHRAPGRPWSTPASLGGRHVVTAQLAVGGDGDLTVMYERWGYPRSVLWTQSRPHVP